MAEQNDGYCLSLVWENDSGPWGSDFALRASPDKLRALQSAASVFALRASPDKSLEVALGGTLSSASVHRRLSHYKTPG